MLTTTFAAVLVSAALAEAPSAPAWETNYARASETAVAQRKPLAVFIGHGESGYNRVVGGNMPTEAGRLLSTSYVALYVNADTAEGKRLATAFGVEEGLVISSRCGNLQALKYGGAVPALDLASYLTKYSAADVAVTTTERAGTAVVAAPVVTSSCANGRCGTVVTGGYYTPAYTGGVSSCPNGRCPNVR
ncbi:hypothetical protein [Urbifossiella limnaea]|uniref:Uncharacterized protein n=1 Tax=Urbifossiella limnaea TaxID=2528023 RepID=A0A517Y0D8_9BACT|nr:hypothetical protein [Urbifossiella limnaea]QDU23226.1 hypothetical protein ETAA1_52180 [Urbifossiella limnaea]